MSNGYTRNSVQSQEAEDLAFYDPDQDPEARRLVRMKIRETDRELFERRDELLQPGNTDLLEFIKSYDELMGEVKQTSDATLDSRGMLNVSEIELRKAQNAALGETGMGIDVDEFVSKCITFMRNGGPLDGNQEALASTQTQRQRRRDVVMTHEDDEDEDGDILDWAVFGEHACFPNNRRPPTPGFLLGPLSVQKRVRIVTRRARQEQRSRAAEIRPDELKVQDLQRNESNNLTSMCQNIRACLANHINTAGEAIDEVAEDEDEAAGLLSEYRVTVSENQELSVLLMDFAINPHSFGQTVENLFYISFLIRDGSAELDFDESGEAVLRKLLRSVYLSGHLLVHCNIFFHQVHFFCTNCSRTGPAVPRTLEEQRQQHASKQQAILGLDYDTWRKFIEAYDITESLIPHREDMATQPVTAGGWYG
jgi:non-structural maintenance of chromosomes element 4